MNDLSNSKIKKNPRRSSKLYTKWRVFLFKIKKQFLYKEDIKKIFVYGSLRKGARNFDKIKNFIFSSQNGTVRGKLYVRKDNYVFLIDAKGKVVGELLSIKGGNAALKLFDLFEGREYKRKFVPIKTQDGIEEAYVYYYSGQIPLDSTHIKSGDWIEFVKIS